MLEETLHPAEEHELVGYTVTRVVRADNGRVVGRVDNIMPGTLAEREVLRDIESARFSEQASLLDDFPSRRRRARRHWARRGRP